MLITYDTASDVLYVYLARADAHQVAATRVVDDARIVRYDAEDEPIGIEFSFASTGIDLDGLPRAVEVAEALAAFPRLA